MTVCEQMCGWHGKLCDVSSVHLTVSLDCCCSVCVRLVIEALKEVDGDRKCFRMVGGVLVERTVRDVLPAMLNNYEQVEFFICYCDSYVITNCSARTSPSIRDAPLRFPHDRLFGIRIPRAKFG